MCKIKTDRINFNQIKAYLSSISNQQRQSVNGSGQLDNQQSISPSSPGSNEEICDDKRNNDKVQEQKKEIGFADITSSKSTPIPETQQER